VFALEADITLAFAFVGVTVKANSSQISYKYLERESMHYHGIECTRSFYMGLISAEDQKLHVLKEQQTIVLSTLNINYGEKACQ